MEIHHQTCQSCKSIAMKNLIVRHSRKEIVFVYCNDCEKLVSRYELSHYFHYGKGYESYLDYLRRVGSFESEHQILSDFDKYSEEAVKEFQEALAQWKAVKGLNA